MRTVLAALLLVGLLLSGCASKGGGGDDDEDPTGTATASGTASGSKSGSTSKGPSGSGTSTQTGSGSPGNKAPVGGIAATVNGTSVAFNLTGTDPDGDALQWTLSFGDGAADQQGTTLPANLTHTYAVGNYTAHYNVTDGKATSSYNVSVAVAAAATGGGLTFSADVENFCSFCTEVLGEQDGSEPASAFPSVSWASGDQGVDAVWVVIPAALVGHAWSATTTGADIAIAAFTACEPDAHFIQMVDTGAIPETGTIPAGTGCMVLWEYFSYLPPPIGTPSTPGPQTLSLTVA